MAQFVGAYTGTWQSSEARGTAAIVIDPGGTITGVFTHEAYQETGQVILGTIQDGGDTFLRVRYTANAIVETFSGYFSLTDSGGLAGPLFRWAGDVNVTTNFSLERVE